MKNTQFIWFAILFCVAPVVRLPLFLRFFERFAREYEEQVAPKDVFHKD